MFRTVLQTSSDLNGTFEFEKLKAMKKPWLQAWMKGVDNGQTAFNRLPMLHIFAEQGHATGINRRSNNQAVPVTERIGFPQSGCQQVLGCVRGDDFTVLMPAMNQNTYLLLRHIQFFD